MNRWIRYRSFLRLMLLSVLMMAPTARSNLDIDGDGKAAALTDGLLVLRHLFGFGGDALTVGAVGIEATRTQEDIERTLVALSAPAPSPRARPVVRDALQRSIGSVLGVDAVSLSVSVRGVVATSKGAQPILFRVLGSRRLGAYEDAVFSGPFFATDDCTGPMYISTAGEGNGFLVGLSVPYAIAYLESPAFGFAPRAARLIVGITAVGESIVPRARAAFSPVRGPSGEIVGADRMCSPQASSSAVSAVEAEDAGAWADHFPAPFTFSFEQ